MLAERVTRESDPRATPGTCAATAPPQRESPVRIWDGVEIRGGDLRRGPPVPAPASREDCCRACLAEPDCRGWVLVKDAGVCWLKGRWAGEPEADACCEGADMRPGGDSRAREAARKTAELEEQKAARERAEASSPSRGARHRVARGGGAARAGELRRERERDAAEGLARRKAPPLAAGGRIGGHLLILVPTVARPGSTTSPGPSTLRSRRRGEGSTASTG